MRLSIRVLVTGYALLASALLSAQTPALKSFDVSTIKPTAAVDRGSSGISTGHSKLDARNVTVKRLIMGAYTVGPHQVVGGPDWMNSERYDVLAKTEQTLDDDDAFMLLLRGLLAERFQLQVHSETRTMTAYVLETAKDGPKLGKPDPGEGSDNTSESNTSARIDSHHTSMARLAQLLGRVLDLPVIDGTGITGSYTFQLHWLPQNGSAAAEAGSDELPMLTAIQEQLGLRLRVAKVPVPVLVVDRLERPSAN